MTETESWIVDHFKAHGEVPDGSAEDLLEVNYFEREMLSSLGIVQMVVGLEDDLEVRLESEHMQDPRFCTIRGLGQIVDELRAA